MNGLLILCCGLVFGVGLAVSGLYSQEAVLAFLQFEDFGLLLTMGAGFLVAAPAYRLAPARLAAPLRAETFERFPGEVRPRHWLGGALFGLGWGVSGVCPGAALASLGAGNWPMLSGLAGMLLGAYVQGRLEGARRPAGSER